MIEGLSLARLIIKIFMSINITLLGLVKSLCSTVWSSTGLCMHTAVVLAILRFHDHYCFGLYCVVQIHHLIKFPRIFGNYSPTMVTMIVINYFVSCDILNQSYYSVYGGAAAQYPVYGTGLGGLMTGAATAFYPYLQFGEGNGGATAASLTSGQGYGVYPHHLFQYSAINSTGNYPQNYGAPMSLAPTPVLQSGLCCIYQILIFLLQIIIQ